MMALVPRLAPLDERVLAALTMERGCRARMVAKAMHGQPGYRCEACGRETRVGGVSDRKRAGWEARPVMTCPMWAGGCGGRERPVLLVSDDELREVREILRGLERCRPGGAGRRLVAADVSGAPGRPWLSQALVDRTRRL